MELILNILNDKLVEQENKIRKLSTLRTEMNKLEKEAVDLTNSLMDQVEARDAEIADLKTRLVK